MPKVNDAVDKVLVALRTVGYEPSRHIEDVEIIGGGPLPVWTPARSAGQSRPAWETPQS